MANVIEIGASDFAAMMCSFVCHDLINPVGAIGNGLEVLADPTQTEMVEFAKDLITSSARQARARLEFARLAFGASSAAGNDIDTREAERVAQQLFEDEKATLEWAIAPMLMPKNKVKLLLNMLLIATGGVPRGGTVKAEVTGEPGSETFTLVATGPKTLLQSAIPALLAGAPEDGQINARVIQPFYTGQLARETGMVLTIVLEDSVLNFTAEPQPGDNAEAA